MGKKLLSPPLTGFKDSSAKSGEPHVDTLKKLCLAPSDMGSNYQLNHEEMRQLLRDTLRVERGSILEPIRAIEVRPFFENGSKVSSAS